MKKYFCYGKKDFCTSFECDKGVDCAHYDGSGGEDRDAPMTNADRIRAISDDELAEFIKHIKVRAALCKAVKNNDAFEELCSAEWLQQPAEEADYVV